MGKLIYLSYVLTVRTKCVTLTMLRIMLISVNICYNYHQKKKLYPKLLVIVEPTSEIPKWKDSGIFLLN